MRLLEMNSEISSNSNTHTYHLGKDPLRKPVHQTLAKPRGSTHRLQ